MGRFSTLQVAEAAIAYVRKHRKVAPRATGTSLAAYIENPVRPAFFWVLPSLEWVGLRWATAAVLSYEPVPSRKRSVSLCRQPLLLPTNERSSLVRNYLKSRF